MQKQDYVTYQGRGGWSARGVRELQAACAGFQTLRLTPKTPQALFEWGTNWGAILKTEEGNLHISEAYHIVLAEREGFEPSMGY